ncbi:MAG: hypothetical protein ABW277_15375 [Longimicrobiaceae bacterium]
MDGPAAFGEAIRDVAAGLRDDAPSHTRLNRAEARIDGLGRRLHGFGYVRGQEIADCFTAALRELAGSHALPDGERAEAVDQAVAQLAAAADHAAEGVLPAPP